MASLINLIVGFINGLIVGIFSFVLGLLDSLDNIGSLLDHAGSSVFNFIDAILTLGTRIFPFVPAEWMAVIESLLIVLVAGIIIRKKVLDS